MTGKKAKLSDVAKAAGVSSATVDRVLNKRGGVNPHKEKQVLEWARKLQLDRNLERRPSRILRLGVIMQAPANPFYRSLQQAFMRCNSLYGGLNIQVQQHYFEVTAVKQTAALMHRVAERSDALIVIVPDHPLSNQALQEVASRMPVITMVSDLPLASRLAYIGIDNRAAGRTAGELMGRYVGSQPCNIVVVSGMHSFIGQGEREMGFRAVLAERYPHCHLLAVVETREQPEKAGQLVRQLLRQHQRLAGIYNLSTGDQSIADALQAYAQQQETVFITHELTEERRALLRDGVIDIVLDQNPELEAMTAVKYLAQHFGRIEAEAITTLTPVSVHTRENS
ncbi:LacI family transcriptional regulator [Pokkaliibacter plantistimulans]|uniref:LacI family transcriptional regulator n=1 Tax=Proteobacteria bacterium 228 TaxID=2083153 RepID=A0A2S5KRM0_9PROT|nr:LacI family DNA-binding transcriptional regulator [Pokkaliibacter plantistimulans]PPC77501.1 LacI family transcriptional regulator [Pokkaliibacter plantistimulans]